ncbi:MAG: hypothetical protein LBC74_02145 [Planctomycetaceae bacterium]|jgi:hypothetical protein|nr:hypothetical protein [Planctomycetaceae bacterium]
MQNNPTDQNDGSYQVNGESYRVDYIPVPPPKSGCGGYGCLMGCGIGCLVLLIIAVVIGVLFYYYCVKGIPLKISPETTIISSPLKSDGKSVDFFSAIKEKIEPKDPAKNNGFKNVLNAYGKELITNSKQEELSYGWIFPELCKSIGLDPNLKPTHIYKEPDFTKIKPANKEINKQNEKEKENDVAEIQENKQDSSEITVFKNILSKNWSINEYPKLKEWLEKVDSGLDVVQKAAMEEIYFVPMVRRNEKELAVMSIPSTIRGNAKLLQGLQVRSMLRIGEGEFGKAWDDMIASIHLKLNLINKGIHIFDNRSDQTRLQIIKTIAKSSSNWTPEQINKAISDLESIPPSPKREDVLLIVQFILLDVFSTAGDSKQFVESISGQTLDSHPTSEQLNNLTNLMELCGFNWNIAAKKLNEAAEIHKKTINDTDTEKILNATGKNIKQELDEFSQRLSVQIHDQMANIITVSGRSEIAGFVVGEFVPILEKYIFKQTLNDEIHHRLLQTTFSIERYKSEHKKYPKSLDQLKLPPPAVTAIKTDYKTTDKGYKISICDTELEITPNTL